MVRPLSTRPEMIRKRLRSSAKDIDRDVAMLYGKPVSEWDFEELQRGRPRDPETGRFPRGPKPKWITDITMGEVRRRLQMMAKDQVASHTSSALGAIRDLMTDDREDANGRPMTPASVKFQAAQYVLDQIIGKPSSKVELSGSVELQHILAKIMVNPDGEDAHPVIEGYVEEELIDDDE